MPKLSNLKFINKININLTVVFYIVLKNTVIMNEIRYRINNNNILSMYISTLHNVYTLCRVEM